MGVYASNCTCLNHIVIGTVVIGTSFTRMKILYSNETHQSSMRCIPRIAREYLWQF